MASTPQLIGYTYLMVTFGCQMNKHDSERISGILESLGAVEVADIEAADIVVYMTCCVREAADTRLYGQIASMKNIPVRDDSPASKRYVVVGGCIAQRDGGAVFEKAPHVDVVFGTHSIGQLPRLLEEAFEIDGKAIDTDEASREFSTDYPSKPEKPYSAWLPIMTGCNNFCTYCIVPYVRGREQSRTIEDVVSDAEKLVASGVKEITLLGQNVNSYGRDLYGNPRFAELLERIDATGITRLRFATSHPKDISDDVIEAFATLDSLMPYLHLPVQSGSNAILKAMNRNYTAEHYLKIIEKLRRAVPDIALSTDIIVGFPGETEQDFLDTYDLVKAVGYQQVFSFIYSKREGTRAAEMEQTSTREEIQARFDKLVDAIQDSAYRENQRSVGSTQEILFDGLSKRDASMLAGTSERNQTVHVPLPDGMSEKDFEGVLLPVEIESAKTWYLVGRFCQSA